VLPEIRELSFLSANAEDYGSGAKLAPASTSQTPQLRQRSMQALTYNFTAAQPDFVDAMRLFRIATVAHVVDQKYPYLGQRQKGFTRPLLDQVRRCHDQSRKRSSGTMHQHASQRDEGFARAALSDDIGIPRQLPTLAHAHDRKGLRWIWNTHHPGNQRGWSFFGAVQGWVRPENSFSDFIRVSPQVIVNRI